MGETGESSAGVQRRTLGDTGYRPLAAPTPRRVIVRKRQDVQRSTPPDPDTLKNLPPAIAHEPLLMTPSVAPVALPSTPPPPLVAVPPRSTGVVVVVVALVVFIAGAGSIAAMFAPHAPTPRATVASAPRSAVTIIEAKTAQPESIPVDALPPSAPATTPSPAPKPSANATSTAAPAKDPLHL